jgi:hypothetical protein
VRFDAGRDFRRDIGYSVNKGLYGRAAVASISGDALSELSSITKVCPSLNARRGHTTVAASGRKHWNLLLTQILTLCQIITRL